MLTLTEEKWLDIYFFRNINALLVTFVILSSSLLARTHQNWHKELHPGGANISEIIFFLQLKTIIYYFMRLLDINYKRKHLTNYPTGFPKK